MKAVFKTSVEEAPGIFSYYFTPEKPLRYIPGQFIELTLPHDKPDDRGISRWFTLTSIETDDEIQITTKLTEQSSSFKSHVQTLRPGDEVSVSEPMGDFVLPRNSETPLLFVAGGMGVTPFVSMLRHIAKTNETHDIQFLYAVHSEDDIIFQEVFDAAHVHATIVVSNPSEAWGGERGHLSANHVLKLTEPKPDSLVYLAGPEPMVEELHKDLLAQKIPSNQLVTDFFHGYEPL
jgi:glycine betaine catabolism B